MPFHFVASAVLVEFGEIIPQGTVSSWLWSRSVGNAGSWCVQCMSTVVVSTCRRCGISKCFKCIGVHRHTYALCDYQCAQCLVEASGLSTEAASSVLADGVHQLRAAAREPSTFAHQATAMNHLRRCAAALGTQVLPMSVDLAPMVIAFFVQEGNSSSVLAGIRSAVTVWHAAHGLPSPFDFAPVQLLWDGAKRLTGRPVKHYEPFPYQKWLHMVQVLVHRGTLVALRDSVWLCLAFLGFSRHSEISGRKSEPEFARGFRFSDVDLSDPNRVRLFVRACKADVEGKGAWKVISAHTQSGVNFHKILVQYFGLLGLTVGQASRCHLPLVQPTNVRGFPRVSTKRFRVDQRFKELQKQFFGVALYTMHCLRVGGSEHSLARGVEPMLGKAHGLWASDAYWLYARCYQEEARMAVTAAM